MRTAPAIGAVFFLVRTQSRRVRFSRRSTAKAQRHAKRDLARTGGARNENVLESAADRVARGGGRHDNVGLRQRAKLMVMTMAMTIAMTMAMPTAMATPIPMRYGPDSGYGPTMASAFPMTAAAIATIMAARTITGTCRSITVRSSMATNGSTARSITATGMAGGNTGSMAAGAPTNGAVRVRAGGMKAAMVPRWAWTSIAAMASAAASTIIAASTIAGFDNRQFDNHRFDNNRSFDNRNFQNRVPENRGFDNRGFRRSAISTGDRVRRRSTSNRRQQFRSARTSTAMTSDRRDFGGRGFPQQQCAAPAIGAANPPGSRSKRRNSNRRRARTVNVAAIMTARGGGDRHHNR